MSTTYVHVCRVLFICLENHSLVRGSREMSGNFMLKILNEPCLFSSDPASCVGHARTQICAHIKWFPLSYCWDWLLLLLLYYWVKMRGVEQCGLLRPPKRGLLLGDLFYISDCYSLFVLFFVIVVVFHVNRKTPRTICWRNFQCLWYLIMWMFIARYLTQVGWEHRTLQITSFRKKENQSTSKTSINVDRTHTHAHTYTHTRTHNNGNVFDVVVVLGIPVCELL